MINSKLSTSKKDVIKGESQVLVWRRVDSISKSWKSIFIKAGICVPDINKDGQFRVEYTRHDSRRGWNEAAERLGLSLKERSIILGHEPKVNKSNYNGERQIDLDSVSKRIVNLRLVESAS